VTCLGSTGDDGFGASQRGCWRVKDVDLAVVGAGDDLVYAGVP